MSIESVMPSTHLTLCCPLLLSPSIFPSIRVFSKESVPHIRWPKYWCFSFSISPSNEYPGLISYRMDWLDLLAVQRTLKSLLQHHSSMYMQNTLCKMPGWMHHKLESRCREKYQQPQICRWHRSNDRKWRGTKEPLDDGERGEWKSWLKTKY